MSIMQPVESLEGQGASIQNETNIFTKNENRSQIKRYYKIVEVAEVKRNSTDNFYQNMCYVQGPQGRHFAVSPFPAVINSFLDVIIMTWTPTM